MDIEKINLRIAEILKHYELSASSFADSINVQRSSISHLLKGRNKPSLEFVSKLVQAYPEVDLYWLLYGEGEFPKVASKEIPQENTSKPTIKTPTLSAEKEIEKILLFYKDGTFKSYEPES
jgi:transcriptional regulator with XRE-family HTH domain